MGITIKEIVLQMQRKVFLFPFPLLGGLLMLALFSDEVLINPVPSTLLVSSLGRAELPRPYFVPGLLETADLAPVNLAVFLGLVLLMLVRHVRVSVFDCH